MTAVEAPAAPPRLAPLYARALLSLARRRPAVPGLPDQEPVLNPVLVDRSALAAYDDVCGYLLRDTLPPTYPHVLGFPLQVRLMTDAAFPFALPGLVHVRNVIRQHRPISADEPLTVRVHAERLAAHPKGAQVDLVTAVAVDGEPVWDGRSTYLARGASAPAGAADVSPPDAPPEAPGPPRAVWRVPADVGRRYAAVSGDANPIHLSALAARAFGFRSAIAHGMWMKARVLAALEPRLPTAFTADVSFRKPLLLPATAHLCVSARDDGWDVSVRDSSGTANMSTSVRADGAVAGRQLTDAVSDFALPRSVVSHAGATDAQTRASHQRPRRH